MQFSPPFIKATLIKRYKRFLADVIINGETHTAHCPNTGTMKTCGDEGDEIYLSFHPDSGRKLLYTWELTKSKKGFIGVNTHMVNKIVLEALSNGVISEVKEFKKITPEKKLLDGRIDFLLEDDKNNRCWIEAKNVTLLKDEGIFFPDAVSERALKHLEILIKAKENGDRACILFVVNRAEGTFFSPAEEIHPEYAKKLREAATRGVEILAYRSLNTPNSMILKNRVKIELGM